jgi:hypothetical protein
MELVILNALKFDLSFADPYLFLERYLKAAHSSDDMVGIMYYSIVTSPAWVDLV